MRFFALALLTGLALPARAQNTPVLTSITAEVASDLARDAAASFGVPAVAEAYQVPDSTYVIAVDAVMQGAAGTPADTVRFFVSLDDCTGADCSVMSAVILFGGQTGTVTPENANTWNAAHRYTRVYLDEDNVVLQADLDVHYGVTRETVRGFLQTYFVALDTFLYGEEQAGAP